MWGSPCYRWRWTRAASDQTSPLKGCLTSLASTLRSTKKGLTTVHFSFLFPCFFPFPSKLWRKHAPSILFSPDTPSFHFSVLHRRATDVCLPQRHTQCDPRFITLGSGMSVLSSHLCAGLHIVIVKDTLKVFLPLSSSSGIAWVMTDVSTLGKEKPSLNHEDGLNQSSNKLLFPPTGSEPEQRIRDLFILCLTTDTEECTS